MDDKYRSRKFGLAVFFTVAGTIAFYMKLMGAGEWLALVGEVLALYGWANVVEKKNA